MQSLYVISQYAISHVIPQMQPLICNFSHAISEFHVCNLSILYAIFHKQFLKCKLSHCDLYLLHTLFCHITILFVQFANMVSVTVKIVIPETFVLFRELSRVRECTPKYRIRSSWGPNCARSYGNRAILTAVTTQPREWSATRCTTLTSKDVLRW